MIGFWPDFFTVLQVVVGVFLIFIIMLQRGKGGGLVGALGGMGGASAFGPKADVQVLKLTIGLAVAWVFLACVGIFFNRSYASVAYDPTSKQAPAAEGKADGAKVDAAGDSKAAASGTTTPGVEVQAPAKTDDAAAKDAAVKAEAKPAATAPPAAKEDAAAAQPAAPAAKADTEKK